MKNFFEELRRRNVIKAAISYLIFSWALLQVADILFPIIDIPPSVLRYLLVVLIICFPGWLVFAYIYELTPNGIKKRAEIVQPEKKGKFLVLGVVFVLLLIISSYFLYVKEGSSHEAVEVNDKSLAVLAFVDLSPAKDQEWFSDGLTDELLNSLTRVPELKLISRTSSYAFKGKNLPIKEIADSLHVSYIIEGSVRKANNQIRVTAKLINAESGIQLWSSTYDRTMDDIFSIQADISENIVHALNILLDERTSQNFFSSGTKNVEAFEEFLKGTAKYNLYHNSGVMDTLVAANRHFEKAISIDPKFAKAYFLHADYYEHALVEGRAKELGLTEEELYNKLINDLSAAIQFATVESDKLSYQLNKIYFSNDWSEAAHILDQIIKSDVLNMEPGWGDEFLSLRDPAFLLKRRMRQLETDPFNQYAKYNVMQCLLRFNLVDSVENMLAKIPSKDLPNKQMEWKIQIQKGNFQKALEIAKVNFPSNWGQIKLSKLLAGKNEGVMDELKSELNSNPFMAINFYNALGNYDKADSAARYIDSKFSGPSLLENYIAWDSYNRIYFHLSATPNFSARLKELGIDVVQYEKDNYYQYPVVKIKN
jgi:TolB-like protein